MVPFEEDERTEYEALMSRARDAEQIALLSYVVSGLVAAVLLSWAIGRRNAALLLPVQVAIAFGFTAVLRARQSVKLIAGYAEEVMEGSGPGPRWFSHLRKLARTPGFSPNNDWVAASLANTVTVIAMVLSWLYARLMSHGELMAAIVTCCALVFGIYSLSETSRLSRTDFAALWRQVGTEPRAESRRVRAAS